MLEICNGFLSFCKYAAICRIFIDYIKSKFYYIWRWEMTVIAFQWHWPGMTPDSILHSTQHKTHCMPVSVFSLEKSFWWREVEGMILPVKVYFSVLSGPKLNFDLECKISLFITLKSLDTIGNCQRPVLLRVSPHTHKISLWKFELNWSSKLRDKN